MKTELATMQKRDLKKRLAYDMKQNGTVYLMLIPVLAFYIIFCYVPMYGAIIAFKDFSPARGILGSPWVGLAHFMDFFSSRYFVRVLRNTLTISLTTLCVSFPLAIVFALLLNEIRSKMFAKTVQTVTYMPHFISLVVLCGKVADFTASDGIINDLIAFFGGNRSTMLNDPKCFVPVYVLSGIWQNLGWDSIIYISALAGVDQELYEAARFDGAGRLRQTFSITLPGIMPTIIVMFIMAVGNILNVGYEKVILLYNPVTYETADIISTFVYRRGLTDMQFSFSAAVGLVNSLVSFLLVMVTNAICRKYSEASLW